MEDLNGIPRYDDHTHSYFSSIRLIDSINSPETILLTENQLGLKGCCLTDHEFVGGHLKFLEAAKKLKEEGKIDKDFKAALGNEIYLVDDRHNIDKYFHHILNAKNTEGEKALRELSSIAWINGYNSRGMMRVPTERKELERIVKKYPDSLISTSACLAGRDSVYIKRILNAQSDKEANEWRNKLVEFYEWNIKLFGDDFYIEIAAANTEEQKINNEYMKKLAKAFDRKIVIGSDGHYATAKERAAHKAFLNSKEGEREVDAFYYYAHFMDNNEAYSYLKDTFTVDEFKQMCANSMEIYDKIEEYNLYHNPIIPHVEVPEYKKCNKYKGRDLSKYETLTYLLQGNWQERYWVNQCLEALDKKQLFTPEYLDRLNTEADVIKTVSNKLDNCVFEYFNTFQHYIDLFWECGSIVGPGRGSAVCFLSNWLLGITQLNPIKYNLLYFRFLNKDRLELPDIDIDLCPEKREKIFEEIRKERGELNVIQVCTFGTEGTRSAILAAVRGYRSEEYPNGIDVDIGQYLTSLIPQTRGFLPSIHEVVYGDEEKGTKPIQAFIDEVNRYPGLLEIIEGIEGSVCRRGIHASGVIFYNNSPFETNAIMRAPNGTLTTQFDLGDSEKMGDIKFDCLLTEISSKISTCIKLLQKDGLIEKELTLREAYNKYLHPDTMNYDRPEIWNALAEGSVMDVFQFSEGVGLDTAKLIKPTTPLQLSMSNCLMRLQGQPGEERPANRYARLKSDMSQWYKEVRDEWHLTEEEIEVIKPYYLENFGCPCAQEHLMLVCMDKNIGKFTLAEANSARKIIAKKKVKEVPKLKEKFLTQCPSRNLGEYIWKTCILPQASYSFNLGHGIAYSFVGIQTLYLAKTFPEIYWDCACLIVNSGGLELLESSDDNTSPNYGKIGAALGKVKERNIKILPPDINKSDVTFMPSTKDNAILYGLKGLSKIGSSLVQDIIKNRQYNSISDLVDKVKINKTQVVTLIKAGCFDNLYKDRYTALNDYVSSITDQKTAVNMRNIQMLINYNIIPEDYKQYIALYNFNKYIKTDKDKDIYRLNDYATKYYLKNFDEDSLETLNINGGEQQATINQKTWTKLYNKAIDPLKNWIKDNNTEVLNNLNKALVQENIDKYAAGNISAWEMDAMCYYYHPHELENLKPIYNIVDYKQLNPEPVVASTFKTKNGLVPMYKIFRIAGTVIDKDKNKSTVTILTPTSVVPVKIWKDQFAKWDRQISSIDKDGHKHVEEKSWFKRGTKLIITGIRRGDTFVPKKYKSTPYPLFTRIDNIDKNGFITEMSIERIETD